MTNTPFIYSLDTFNTPEGYETERQLAREIVAWADANTSALPVKDMIRQHHGAWPKGVWPALSNDIKDAMGWTSTLEDADLLWNKALIRAAYFYTEGHYEEPGRSA